ncbi:MBL fold metallo-hydrolase [Saccharibacillus sp. CPCC 101409]|uniref:MBL fold metallo-hydrolase n=1 Tax=Saccharibacillus sp. CPCC 101409 TaxID=3058041 RepID=UPI0026735548|nr:MBL fold metallo-hydrolase [Saccharibacillus sp. CPCC 101409]MDO3408468.1 MBL fold metallo-hydrolase [Saccharibacillus sp. CPCC 101409]
MQLQLIRNATLRLRYGGLTWIVDPALSPQGHNPPVRNTPNDRRNPLAPLPVDTESLSSPDAVLLTHLHLDHWDDAGAQNLLTGRLGGEVPLFCQPGDEERIGEKGFTRIYPVESELTHAGVTISRTSGRHGTGEIGRAMGRVSGFVLRAPGEPTLYIAGDTIWCDEVEDALDRYRPDVTVINSGGARFNEGDPITMTPEDAAAVCRYAPDTQVVAVHLEAINHCLTTRADLADGLRKQGLEARVLIPADGETLDF